LSLVEPATYEGFIAIHGGWYSLAPHSSVVWLESKLHEYVPPPPPVQGQPPPPPQYLGPGVARDDLGNLYVRLDNSHSDAQLGRPVAQISQPDPRQHELFICNSNSLGLTIEGSHLVIEGLEINNFHACFLVVAGQTDVTLYKCSGRPAQYGGRVGLIEGLVPECSSTPKS
jgi:hypothetical protein